MVTIDLRFPEEVRDVLLRLAEMIAEIVPGALLSRVHTPDDEDPDFGDVWLAGLTEGIEDDLAAVTRLLADKNFGTAPVEIEEDAIYAALRGFTALRLTLRDTALAKIPDERLETGEFDPSDATPAVRHAYACYGAMSEIQAVLCEILA